MRGVVLCSVVVLVKVGIEVSDGRFLCIRYV